MSNTKIHMKIQKRAVVIYLNGNRIPDRNALDFLKPLILT